MGHITLRQLYAAAAQHEMLLVMEHENLIENLIEYLVENPINYNFLQ